MKEKTTKKPKLTMEYGLIPEEATEHPRQRLSIHSSVVLGSQESSLTTKALKNILDIC